MILLDKLKAVGNTLTVNVSDTMNLTLHVKNVGTTTMSAGTFVFETSLDSTDGTDGTDAILFKSKYKKYTRL